MTLDVTTVHIQCQMKDDLHRKKSYTVWIVSWQFSPKVCCLC